MRTQPEHVLMCVKFKERNKKKNLTKKYNNRWSETNKTNKVSRTIKIYFFENKKNISVQNNKWLSDNSDDATLNENLNKS